MKRGSVELLAVMLLTAIVLGFAASIMLAWNREVNTSKSQLEIAELIRKATSYTLDCLGNYLFAFDPSTLKVYDLNAGTSLTNATYCYSNVPRTQLVGYAIVELQCNGEPLFYVVPGNFTPTVINGAQVFIFEPSVTTLVPSISCTNPIFTGFAYFHIKLPTGLEKTALCYVDEVTFLDSSGTTINAWAVRSCVGA